MSRPTTIWTFVITSVALFMATLDAHVVSLDRKTGRVLWDSEMIDYTLSYSGTHAPLVVNDKVLVGVAGAEYGIRGFIDAFESDDVDAIMAMLAEDTVFSMPPYAGVYRGRGSIRDSWLMPSGPPPRLRYVPTRANGQLAVGTYQLDAGADRYVPIALDVLTLRDDSIAEIVAFRMPELFDRFGLPGELRT